MKINKHSFPLIIILTVIVLLLEAVTLSTLYNASFEQQRAQLSATTQSQARLIESVGSFDKRYHAADVEGSAAAETLKQIRNAHLNTKGFGKSGEFILGRKENNKIIFLLHRRFNGVEVEKGENKLLEVGGAYAEPIQLALEGKSGTIIAYDYRGELVLAAYAPVKVLNYGVVTKIDIKEIRAPFIRVGLISVALATLLIAIGSFLFLRITNPMIKGIEDSASRLNEAQRLAKVGSWELDLTSGALIWSDEIFNIFEIDKAKFEATYEAFLNAIHPDDRDEVNQAYSESLVDRKPYAISHRLQMSDGTIKYVHETCESYFDEENKPVRSVGTVQDITEQKVISQNLQQFKNILDQTLDCVFMFNAEDLLFYYVNEGAIQQVGYSHNELITMHAYDIKPEMSKSGFIELIAPLVNGEKSSLNFETVHQHKEGMLIPVDIFLQYISDEDGTASFVAIVRDITERKKTERELVVHREHLEDLIEERTKELQDIQDELVRKGRLATMGQLTATVSHELRNPLGAMRPSLYVIKKKSDPSDEKIQNAIDRVDRNIDRCDRIIDELLDFTRITELNLVSTKIDEWLEAVIDEQIIPEGLKIEKDFSLKDLELNVDRDRIRRVIINVFENASHSMMDNSQQIIESKSSCIKIKTREESERVEIIISDTGSGIEKDILDKIFEPLFSTKGFGVGLGMPTVKQIMEQHYGGIEIDSKKNKGTQVTLWLPMNVAKKDSKEVTV